MRKDYNKRGQAAYGKRQSRFVSDEATAEASHVARAGSRGGMGIAAVDAPDRESTQVNAEGIREFL